MENMCVRLTRGWVKFARETGSGWRLVWEPDDGPARKYSPQGRDLPPDYPGGDDLEKLLEWARRRFGEAG
jgi:hypothetical protein